MKNNLEEVCLNCEYSFQGYGESSMNYSLRCSMKDDVSANEKDSCKAFEINSYYKVKQLEQELQETREHLGKAIKSAEFFMSHADCKRDSWVCKCSFCRDTESSKNLREARQYFQDKDKQGE